MTLPVGDKETRVSKPPWLKVKAPGSKAYLTTRKIVRDLKLHTVCEEAACPNIGDCWSHKTATFLILGEYCSRHCRFCNIKDSPPRKLDSPDPTEPEKIGQAVQKLGLKHVVITSVTRDDLPDFGSEHFAKTVRSVRNHSPDCKVELLIPDLMGSKDALRTILESGVDILNHNIETVPRLYNSVRPEAIYDRSLAVLSNSKKMYPEALTKSGLMVGLGETKAEIVDVMSDLISNQVDILTIGQYLRPSKAEIPVKAYYTPDEFIEFEETALKKGFKFVESGALVRSSYHAWKHSQVT